MSLHPITIKRLNGDLKKFSKAKPEFFKIYPNPKNMLEIYFLLIGRPDTPFEGGHYLGMIKHHPEYPKKAPDYYFYTPNGRFHLNNKICLTNSGYHQSDWAPAAWNLVSLLEGLSSVFHSDIKEDKVGIGHINNTTNECKLMAQSSITFNTIHYNDIYKKLIN